MDIVIHSTTHVEISHAGGVVALEHDDAADFLEAVEAEPSRAQELAAIAVAAD